MSGKRGEDSKLIWVGGYISSMLLDLNWRDGGLDKINQTNTLMLIYKTIGYLV